MERLFTELDLIRTGDIAQVEVRGGLRVRMSIKTAVQE
jgi:hypothetical protein